MPQMVIEYDADSALRAFFRRNFADAVGATHVQKFGSRAFSWRYLVPPALVTSPLGSAVLWLLFLRLR